MKVPCLKGEHLSHMTNDELDFGKCVEESAIEQAQNVESNLLILRQLSVSTISSRTSDWRQTRLITRQ